MTHASPRFASVKEVLSLVWSQATPFIRLRVIIALALVLLAGMLAPLGPLALKLIVDDFTGHSATGAIPVGVLAASYVMSQWLSRSIGEVRGWVYSRAERRMFRTLSERLFGHIMRLPLRFHLERQTGAITQTLENGLQGYQRIVNQIVFTFLPVTVQLGTIAFILLRFDQPVFLGLFGVAAISYGIAFGAFARRVSGPARDASTARIDANGTITDSIMNYETVKLFAAEDLVQNKVSRALVNTEDRWGSFYRMSATNGLLVATLYSCFLGLSIGYAVHLVGRGRMTVGDFILVNTYMLQVMQPVEMLGRAVQGLAQGAAMLDKMLELFREKPESHTSSSRRPESEATDALGELEFRNVSSSYRADRQILRDVSFKVPRGRAIGIVGASGAGKSTIVRLLVRLIEADGGSVLLDGVPISELALPQLRRAIAVVPQDTVLFNDSIAYNIGFGKPGSSQDEIEEAARVARLQEFIARLPEGYATRVGERGVKLSGGEKQRISIARAALKRPRIYVFDEATSSLDSRTELEILWNLQELSRHATTLVIAHRLSTVVHADEIVVLDRGVVVERGSHRELLQKGAAYAALWRAQNSQRKPISAGF